MPAPVSSDCLPTVTLPDATGPVASLPITVEVSETTGTPVITALTRPAFRVRRSTCCGDGSATADPPASLSPASLRWCTRVFSTVTKALS